MIVFQPSVFVLFR